MKLYQLKIVLEKEYPCRDEKYIETIKEYSKNEAKLHDRFMELLLNPNSVEGEIKEMEINQIKNIRKV